MSQEENMLSDPDDIIGGNAETVEQPPYKCIHITLDKRQRPCRYANTSITGFLPSARMDSDARHQRQVTDDITDMIASAIDDKEIANILERRSDKFAFRVIARHADGISNYPILTVDHHGEPIPEFLGTDEESTMALIEKNGHDKASLEDISWLAKRFISQGANLNIERVRTEAERFFAKNFKTRSLPQIITGKPFYGYFTRADKKFDRMIMLVYDTNPPGLTPLQIHPVSGDILNFQQNDAFSLRPYLKAVVTVDFTA